MTGRAPSTCRAAPRGAYTRLWAPHLRRCHDCLSPLHRDGTPWVGTPDVDGASFERAVLAKERTYPELAVPNPLWRPNGPGLRNRRTLAHHSAKHGLPACSHPGHNSSSSPAPRSSPGIQSPLVEPPGRRPPAHCRQQLAGPAGDGWRPGGGPRAVLGRGPPNSPGIPDVQPGAVVAELLVAVACLFLA